MLTQERLKQLLRYDPDTGAFTRLAGGHGVRVGDLAGTYHPLGYRLISVAGRRTLGQRLAWLYMTGEWPRRVRFKNGRPDDLRWNNLIPGVNN